jgi:hypothetical protein
VAGFEFAPGELVLLARCCRTIDVLDRLDAVLLGADDLMVEGSVGQLKPHPALAAKADQERLLDQLVRGLNLPLEGEEEGRRRSPSAREAAQARWRAQREERGHGQAAT